ncbi:hypothetical protein BDZ89DRAFT_1063596 [Hymenopellis radicata]|nr:hypothetical protein BDZ89DRAFT_1063596 [Hymenopellis radicata]
MLSRSPSLPPELVDMIVQYLSDDKRALRSCTLVSRTWSSFSQRTLFRNTEFDLYSYSRMAKLHEALLSVPHLQTFIRRVMITQQDEISLKTRRSNDISLATYMSCLTSLLSLLPNLVFMGFYFLDKDDGNKDAIQSYLDLIQIPRSSLLAELDLEFIFTVEDFHVAFEALEGTNIKRVTLFGVFDEPDIVGVGASVKRLHLPSLECICLEGGGLHAHFHDWLTRRVDLPNLKQCEIILGNGSHELSAWRDVLFRGFPPLKFFKFEMTDGMDYHGSEEDALCPLPLAGLHFQHVHLGIDCGSEYPCQVIKWWSSTFRVMSDSTATIHFTELTFTFTDPENDALKAAWQSLDDILSHPVFSTVRSIHFEKSDQNVLITQVVYPTLADKVRLALPRLASRGVLCFV